MAVICRDTQSSRSVASVTSLTFQPSAYRPKPEPLRDPPYRVRVFNGPHIKSEIQAHFGAGFLPGDSERVELKLRPKRAAPGGAILTTPAPETETTQGEKESGLPPPARLLARRHKGLLSGWADIPLSPIRKH